MNFKVLTIFPEMITDGLNHSIIKKAQENNIISIDAIDIRDFTKNKHKKVDDYGYGGGAGMIMSCEPIYNAYKSLELKENTKVLYMSPKGKTLTQNLVKELAKEEELVILCGHYEGVDQRIIDEIVTCEISIGDYVLTGGELPAMILIDSISRLIPSVLNKDESHQNESFENNLLEYPQYTRPVDFLGRLVPEVLLSGNHQNIEKWRKEQSLEITKDRRLDLFESTD
ncbi:MAG: tRNA (guanosine(37)-N1)-methyltransferase TrmD [Lachnospirales bacterium]